MLFFNSFDMNSKINTDWMSNNERRFFKEKMSRQRVQHFKFSNIPPSERLTYELVDEDNYEVIFEMFGGDKNPFVSDNYKTLRQVASYSFYLLYDVKFSAKKTGCDWLFKLKDTGEYVGLLNMYDMSRENFADVNKQCTIGFSTAASFRRKGYTLEAIQSLVKHIFESYSIQQRILAYTEKENIASQNLLNKLGFTEPEEVYFGTSVYSYFNLWREKNR